MHAQSDWSQNRPFDRVLTNCRVIDPANQIDGRCDVAIRNGVIAAVGPGLAHQPSRETLDLGGALVTPGLIDVHVHVYEWVTNFGVPADAAGVHSGVTTVIDQGSAGAWTFGGFNAFVIEPAQTDVRSFVSINLAGALKGGMEGQLLHNPAFVRIDEIVALAAAHPGRVAGIKCHGESGSQSYWDLDVLRLAVNAGEASGLPLYMHTGELFPVDESHRPEPDTVAARALALLRPGDMAAHVYSCMPDGIMGRSDRVPDYLTEARDRGVLFDLGHGINLSFRIARAMMAAGIYPDTLGSDVHGDFTSYHDYSILDYSLMGGVNKMVALGMPLNDAIARVTLNPAKFLQDPCIGSLTPGMPANITVLDKIEGDWSYRDAEGEELNVTSRWVPSLVFRAGQRIEPDCGLLADLLSPAARPRGITRSMRHAQR